MASIGINLKINVNKIDKARLFHGEKGTYLDCVVFINTTKPDKYGYHGTIKQQNTKEEREHGEEMPIMGNAKIFWSSEKNETKKKVEKKVDVSDEPDDDVPF